MIFGKIVFQWLGKDLNLEMIIFSLGKIEVLLIWM